MRYWVTVLFDDERRRDLLNFRGVTALAYFALTLSVVAAGEAQSAKTLPLPGDEFVVQGHSAFLLSAGHLSGSFPKAWVWYAPTLPGLPGPEERWMFERFLQAGISVAGIDVGESYGSPAGRTLFTTFHREMAARGYSSKPVLLGRSRGGLMALAWAVENPDKVGAFAGVYPVCNVASYPGIAKAAPEYGLSTAELEAHLGQHNPVDRLAPLAKAGVPLFAIHGDVDNVVPLHENSGLMRERYAALGGTMDLIVPSGQGHNMWPGFFQSADLVRFVKTHAGPNVTVFAPREYQVIQRADRKGGLLRLSGEIAGTGGLKPIVEARLITSNRPSRWRRVPNDAGGRRFQAQWTAPAAGWHRVEFRARAGRRILADAVVEHVGVGEVFVIAGQSNAANHGEERQRTETGLVAAFDGKGWQLANDPQPGASGSGGSFMPCFGDAIARRFGVPVGIVACAIGATSVREWLPSGTEFPIPPTLTNHVRALPSGNWESSGEIFARFTERMRALGPRGFRAVLWHQGESDANQDDPTRTLPGALYRQYLEELIHDSRRAIGWRAPWFVAQASYHGPGDEGSKDIRAAQASLWRDGVALEGPDSDALKHSLRDNRGQGVHFSGPGLREHGARWAEKVGVWLESKGK